MPETSSMIEDDKTRLLKALEHVRAMRQELELAHNMLEACERQRERLERRVNELLADITAITRMDGRE